MPWQPSPTKAHVKALGFHEGSTSLNGIDGIVRVDGEVIGRFLRSQLSPVG